jgi:hypothetical protein
MNKRFEKWLVSRSVLRRSVQFAIALMLPAVARAEYYSFDVPSGADIVSQEVRWPFWAESTYNAVWTNDIVSDDKARVYFYGGVPEANAENPTAHPANIIWSFWPVSHPVHPGETVKVCWSNPRMYAPLAVGEGASGKASGAWPLLKTRQWYQFVLRVWQPIDNPAGHAFASQWLRDPSDGQWYHLATMEVPFKATGTSGMSGFIEDFGHGNRNPRRTEFRNDYYHTPGGDWKPAKNLTPSVRQHGEKGTVDLIENGTASFFETCSGPDYTGNLDYDNHVEKRTVTMSEPDAPSFALPKIASVTAERTGRQILLTWEVAPTASPQFAWKIDALDSEGRAIASSEERDPDARQGFVASTAGNIAKVRLTLTDIFNHTVGSQPLEPKSIQCEPAAKSAGASGVKPGLNFAYAESASAGDSDWTQLPKFTELKSIFSGSTNGIDMTVRRRRTKYAIDYTGFISAPVDGIYGFRLDSFDGSRLVIDGATVVDNDGIHSYTDQRGHAALGKGLHAVEIEYFHDQDRGEHSTFADRVNLQWQAPDAPMAAVPLSAFFHLDKPGQPVATLVPPRNIARVSTAPISNAPVTLDVKITSGSGTVNRVAYYVNDVLWASRDSAPWTSVVTLPVGSFTVHARVFTSDGEAFDTLPQQLLTVQSPTGPWGVVQIGSPPPRRGFGAAATGADALQLVGDGNGIAWQQVTGDATLTAHIAERPQHNRGTQDDGTTPQGDWIGGLMFRSDLVADGTFLGEHFCAAYARVDQSTHFQCQKDHNGGGPVAGPDLGHYDWIKLHRTGNTFTASFSHDGQTWEPGGTRTVELPDRLYACVFILASPGFNPHINGWRFDHVKLESGI